MMWQLTSVCSSAFSGSTSCKHSTAVITEPGDPHRYAYLWSGHARHADGPAMLLSCPPASQDHVSADTCLAHAMTSFSINAGDLALVLQGMQAMPRC